MAMRTMIGQACLCRARPPPFSPSAFAIMSKQTPDLGIRGPGIHPFRRTNSDARHPRPYTPLAAIVAVSVRITAGVVTAGEGARTTGERDDERCKDRAQKNPARDSLDVNHCDRPSYGRLIGQAPRGADDALRGRSHLDTFKRRCTRLRTVLWLSDPRVQAAFGTQKQ